MKRIFGLMPSSEVELRKYYKDDRGIQILIQAGPNGWTIIYGDSSTEYEDVVSTTEENFQKAFEKMNSHFENLIEVKSSECFSVGEK